MSSAFWDASYWLPRNVEWDQVPAKFSDLIYPLYFALPILAFRILLESFVGFHVGAALGYVPKEQVNEKIWNHMTGGFARYTRSKRVLECMFRFVCYTLMFCYGLFVLWDKPWFNDVTQCWIGYPFHQIDSSVWWYYMIETGFYYSLLVGSVFDVKRSDFWELVFHHIITLFLLHVSWTINFVRVGTLVLISHDLSDILLEGGKLVRYGSYPSYMVNICFVFFLLSWFGTRLGYFPFVLLKSAFTDAPSLIQPDYVILNPFQIPYIPRMIIIMLVCLLILHIFWTFIIMRIVIRSVTVGEAADVRSDCEDDDLDKATTDNRKKIEKSRSQRNHETKKQD